nr:radical SAM protein [Candidatus Brocadiia bacterium]
PAPLVQDLDGQMPEMAWDLLPMDRYRAHNWHCFGHLDKRQPYASLYTSLGCPFNCHFCCIHAPFKDGEKALGLRPETNTYRMWSPQSVLAQLEKLVREYGVYNVKFADELFLFNKKHVNAICDGIIARGLRLNIWAYARVDVASDVETYKKLKSAGVNWLCLGIEAGSERVRKDVGKKFSQDKVMDAVANIRAAGIYIIGNFLFGLPDDDLETMQATLDLAQDLNCEFANFYCAMAYPGSGLYQTAVQQGWPLPKSWTGYSQHAADSLPLPTRHISGAEVLRFRDHAFQTYYANPRYLEMIAKTFGQETVAHIREMLGHKLVRNAR